MVLTREQLRAFYDRFGSKQDTQAFYEDVALHDLIAYADFESAQAVFEFGCGTGRLAAELLAKHLPESAAYHGIDLSETMVQLSRRRLSVYAERARINRSDGSIHFPIPDHSVDRVVSTYVLDLLSEADIRQLLAEARRALADDGLLCVMSLTTGKRAFTKLVSGLWSAVFRIYAPVVGGCRPIHLTQFVDAHSWSLKHRNVVSRWGLTSEVVVARPRGG